MARVIIESTRTGEQYSVTEGDYRKHYEAQGFRIASNEDGTPYQTAEKPKRQRASRSKAARAATTEKKAAETDANGSSGT